MGVFLDRQVQRRIRRVQDGRPRATIGDPRHAHLTEWVASPLVSALSPATAVSVGVNHLSQAFLLHRPETETVVQQLPQQIQPIAIQPLCQLAWVIRPPGYRLTAPPTRQTVRTARLMPLRHHWMRILASGSFFIGVLVGR
jgi:hypothetical protein